MRGVERRWWEGCVWRGGAQKRGLEPLWRNSDAAETRGGAASSLDHLKRGRGARVKLAHGSDPNPDRDRDRDPGPDPHLKRGRGARVKLAHGSDARTLTVTVTVTLALTLT